jgi:glycosyltransferase involved in cell wall biosynthesis
VLESQRVAVVIPAYCEGLLIGRTLAGLPDFVDAVYVVDDASSDDTATAAATAGGARLRVLVHAANQGVGAAIVTGYGAALRDGADVVAVMAGDAQMDPSELASVVMPVVAGQADYVKGNRFRSALRRQMPWPRRLAGKVLSAITRWASGLDVDDCQCGYTAIGQRALATLPLAELWPRFGYPNDLLLMAAQHGLRVREVTVRPIYAGEQSGVRPWHALLIVYLILRRALSARPRHQGAGRPIQLLRDLGARIEPAAHQVVLHDGAATPHAGAE